MKKAIWIYVCLFGVFAIQSCKKYELEPRDQDTLELIFDPNDDNATLAQDFLNNIYSFLPGGFARVGGNFLDAGTDDAVPIEPEASVAFYTNGRVSPTTNPDNYFSNSYNGIRQVNIFLANSDKIPVISNNPNRTKTFNAEARFIRAFLYVRYAYHISIGCKSRTSLPMGIVSQKQGCLS